MNPTQPGSDWSAYMLHWIVFYFSPIVLAEYTPSPRWAQAVALQGTTLYVHGGLSDPFNSYSYSSAPETSDLLALDLSASFDASSPPWQLYSSNSSPALAWHTLSAFAHTELLFFGGQPDPNSLMVLTGLNDSAGLLSTSRNPGPTFHLEPQNWGSEPMRRIRHSASYSSGKVWLIGGEKADGSGNAFNEHYYFSPSSPEFVQLPLSSSAPPDIYGHASLVLPDGRLLVLGGYCASCSDLVSMNTIWCLNTTQSTPLWEMVSVSNQSLPYPRRDFAAVVLSNGQVLIHGGGDAQLQTTYSDGWILDTSQNPMVWNGVAALTQLGERKDHFAAQAGGYVLFCFGYGSSAPAPASLLVYDPASSSFVTSYTAPSPGSPAITSLPPPTRTGSKSNSSGITGTAPGIPFGTPSNASASSSGSSDHTTTTAIALGTTFGLLGLIVGILATIYFMKRARNRERRTGSRFFPLEDDPELSSEGSVAGAAPEAAHLDSQTNERAQGDVISDVLTHLGISKFRSISHQPRRDMFVDEDKSFVRAGSTIHRENSERTSARSLPSVGALLRGVIGSEPSGSGTNQGIDHLREGVQEGLIRQGSLHSNCSSHPAIRKAESFWSYTDPFEDPIPDDNYDLNLRPGVPEKDAEYDHALGGDRTDNSGWTALGPTDSIWPFSVHPHTLTPLRELSHTDLSDLSNSLPSLREPSHGQTSHGHADNPALSPSAESSPTPHSPTTSRSSHSQPNITSLPRQSIVSGATLSHSLSISRPDSWWSRLTKPPLLDRRPSITASKPLGFRDPTPAPPLVLLGEMKKPSPTPAHLNNTPDDIPAEHGRSLSSTHSGRTANTDSAEHLVGSYDVVQRLASDGSSSRRVPSLGSAEITEHPLLANNPAASEISVSSALPHVDPPRSIRFSTDSTSSFDVGMPSEPVVSPPLNPTPLKSGGAMVSSRIKAYERRMSRELELQQTPTPRNTRRREEVPSRSRPTIQYGVARRASLFIANPDLGHTS